MIAKVRRAPLGGKRRTGLRFGSDGKVGHGGAFGRENHGIKGVPRALNGNGAGKGNPRALPLRMTAALQSAPRIADAGRTSMSSIVSATCGAVIPIRVARPIAARVNGGWW